MAVKNGLLRHLSVLSALGLVLTITLSVLASTLAVAQMEGARQKDFHVAFDAFLSDQFQAVDDIAVSYANWTDTSDALYNDFIKTGAVSEEIGTS